VSPVESQPTFWRNISPPYSVSKTLTEARFPRNVGWLATDCTALYPNKTVLFITTGVKTSNPAYYGLFLMTERMKGDSEYHSSACLASCSRDRSLELAMPACTWTRLLSEGLPHRTVTCHFTRKLLQKGWSQAVWQNTAPPTCQSASKPQRVGR
jgi:hypothetical protein